MRKTQDRAEGANPGAADRGEGKADKLGPQATTCGRKKRAGSSRRLDPTTHMHWRAADGDTAFAAALLKALRRKAVPR